MHYKVKKNNKTNIRKFTYGFVGMAAAATFLSSSAMAWGPERDTYTMENPADHPTFNSITNNDAYSGAEGFDDFAIGDERDFVRIGEITPDGTVLKNTVEVRPGHQYLVFAYFHNDASASLNKSKVGLALGTKMSSAFSKVVTPDSQGEVSATITSTTTTPAAVWDEAYMTSTERVMMRYVAGSAKIFNNDYATNKETLSEALFTEEGTVLGLTGWNGIIPGCEEYHGVVTYVLQAETLNGTVTKEVSVNGGEYSDTAEIKNGDVVDYKITIRNDGDLPLQYVNLKDSLPAEMEFVSGSVKFAALNSDSPESLPDWNAAGYNFETIGVGNGVVIYYQAVAKMVYPDGLPADECRHEYVNDVENVATLTYGSNTAEGDLRTDTATVTVKHTVDICEDEPEPEPTPTPEPKPEKNCKTNPEMAECQKLPETGPVEITIAIVIILGILGAGFYFYRTKKMLKAANDNAMGKDNNSDNSNNNNA